MGERFAVERYGWKSGNEREKAKREREREKKREPGH